jgi:hypothetical protein
MVQLQVFSILFAMFIIYWSHSSYRRGDIRLMEFLFWFLVWSGFSIAVLFPQSTSVLVERLAINRMMDLFMIVGFTLVWGVVFFTHLEVRRLQRKMVQLVREIALKEGEEEGD